jgi:hypothetical protein
MRKVLFLTFVAQLVLVTAAAAQSLGDLARQEEARRQAIRGSTKVYTNESLRSERSSRAPAPATASAPASGAAADKAQAPAADAKPAADDAKKDEAFWKQRIKAERDALDRAQTFAEALQSRINGLSTDFAARDDPFQRNQIAADRQKALAELERVKLEIQQHTKAITDIQEEARKAGAPAGWVR